MKELIEALQIIFKYGNPSFPTHCEHDIMYISEINPDDVSEDDNDRLATLGFHATNENGFNQYYSHKFGSA